MITFDQYFWNPRLKELKAYLPTERMAAIDLLHRVNLLLYDAHQESDHYDYFVDPDTGTLISGAKGGTGGGGFRLEDEGPTMHSSHKEAKAVDVYDPNGDLDGWIDDAKLKQYGLYREHPDSTPGWCHLTTRAPGSGHRTFYP